jgi:hypothetical protein
LLMYSRIDYIIVFLQFVQVVDQVGCCFNPTFFHVKFKRRRRRRRKRYA